MKLFNLDNYLKETDNTPDQKKILMGLSLPIIKKIYGENITTREIVKLTKELVEDMTGVSFSDDFTFTYIGINFNVKFAVTVHYENANKPCYEVVEDITHNKINEMESNIVCFGNIKSVIDMFITNTLFYVATEETTK